MCTVTKTLNRYPQKHGTSIETLADMLGYENPSTLARHLNHNDHKRPFPFSKLIPIIRACDNDFEGMAQTLVNEMLVVAGEELGGRYTAELDADNNGESPLYWVRISRVSRSECHDLLLYTG
ncbi:MAG: hypothetical protein GY737_01620 [Desulfobacteraceae bacterium]|nr:hypothetical protein [Desulfobacteraceae bacterium]